PAGLLPAGGAHFRMPMADVGDAHAGEKIEVCPALTVGHDRAYRARDLEPERSRRGLRDVAAEEGSERAHSPVKSRRHCGVRSQRIASTGNTESQMSPPTSRRRSLMAISSAGSLRPGPIAKLSTV